MRQIGDTLVWLGVILMVAAVVYYTPRFAGYVNAVALRQDQDKMSWHTPAAKLAASVDRTH